MSRKERDKRYYQKHKMEIGVYNKLYYQATKDKRAAKHRKSSLNYYQTHKEEIAAKRKQLQKPRKTKEERREYRREYAQQLRLKTLLYYGGGKLACAQCDEDRLPCLTIDHINNNGAEHRREIRVSIYWWLKKEGYPKGFQTLCMNCQWVKKSQVNRPLDNA